VRKHDAQKHDPGHPSKAVTHEGQGPRPGAGVSQGVASDLGSFTLDASRGANGAVTGYK
jgi:hypothetical protein